MSCGWDAGAVSDLTYIPVGVNYAYLYVIMDAFSRKIVAGPPVRLVTPKDHARSRSTQCIENGLIGS
jgi:hypothetical protein